MKTTDTDALARLLDGASPDGETSDEARVLAGLAQMMQARAAVAPRPAFREQLRAQLLAEAAAPAAPSWLTRMRAATDDFLARWKYSMRVATASGLAAVALSTGGVAAATTMSVPGDLFYPLKIAVEDARLVRAGGDLDQATMLLSFARARVSEAERAAADGRMDASAGALVAADQSVRRAAGLAIGVFLDDGDEAALAPLSAFTAELRPRLDRLRGQLSGPALDALDDLVVALDRVDARIEALLAGCCPETAGGARPGVPLPGVGFDFTRIPPADEPFEPCPCPATDTLRTPRVPPTPAPAPIPPTPAPTEPPVEIPAPRDEPDEPERPSDPPPPPDEPDEGPLPPPVQEPLDEVRDTLDEVISDVIKPDRGATPSAPDLPAPSLPDVDPSDVLD